MRDLCRVCGGVAGVVRVEVLQVLGCLVPVVEVAVACCGRGTRGPESSEVELTGHGRVRLWSGAPRRPTRYSCTYAVRPVGQRKVCVCRGR